MIYVLFAITMLAIDVYSWGYVLSSMPFTRVVPLVSLVDRHGAVNGLAYVSMLLVLFAWYAYIVRGVLQKRIGSRQLFVYIGILIVTLLFSFPAFSNDIFNYIATAKVTYLYRENPYIVMPIDIPNEPMLVFLQAANKTALYGPTWIAFTALPLIAGAGNLLRTVYCVKILVSVFFTGVLFMIWKLTRRLDAVALFAFNPLVIVDTLVSSHNDVVMMYLALAALYVLLQKRYVRAVLLLLLSVLVKGATVFLVPVFMYVWWRQRVGEVNRERLWLYCTYAMFAVFLLSPLREEIYSWYFIWVLSFAVLRETFDIYWAIALGFTMGLPLRFLPFAVTGSWTGITFLVKKIVTVVLPIASGALWYILHGKVALSLGKPKR